ncbi:MAG: YIP1 family protein [Verrucomicrobia bacterium]|nr:YIP1 family protein [Verrucomicrobiota bacterium]MBS0647183.1 YIP1 family protein [Verrucomicrobiota bacterium]
MENSTKKPGLAWLNLWVHTRHTIRMLIERAPTANILWLALLHGLILGLYWVPTVALYYPYAGASFLYILCLLAGAITGIIQLYVVAWLYLFCGRWLGGQGTYQAVKCAVGWSFYPFIIAGICGILSALTMPHPILQGLFSLISITAFIWGLVILFKVVAEAHRFSAWRAVVAVVIAVLFILAFFFILSFLSALFS